ncbi:hypothetical protein [Trinickia acidisoli]|uniref:hypothetical protein n=1 Tax=Trinickia acidisoli TaxID=2767482 RepID=UPI001A8F6B67|nr:hypothetical protein [Trinickia acidisoli]
MKDAIALVILVMANPAVRIRARRIPLHATSKRRHAATVRAGLIDRSESASKKRRIGRRAQATVLATHAWDEQNEFSFSSPSPEFDLRNTATPQHRNGGTMNRLSLRSNGLETACDEDQHPSTNQLASMIHAMACSIR